jgi:hypothetical protein
LLWQWGSPIHVLKLVVSRQGTGIGRLPLKHPKFPFFNVSLANNSSPLFFQPFKTIGRKGMGDSFPGFNLPRSSRDSANRWRGWASMRPILSGLRTRLAPACPMAGQHPPISGKHPKFLYFNCSDPEQFKPAILPTFRSMLINWTQEVGKPDSFRRVCDWPVVGGVSGHFGPVSGCIRPVAGFGRGGLYL